MQRPDGEFEHPLDGDVTRGQYEVDLMASSDARTQRRCGVVGQTLEGHHHGCDLGRKHEGHHVCFKCRQTFAGPDCYSEPLADYIGRKEHPHADAG